MDVQISFSDVLKDKMAWLCTIAGVTFFMYLLKKFLRGRDQVKRNCDLIGKQLEHLQRVIEENEKKEKEKQSLETGDTGNVVQETTPKGELDKKDK